MERCWKERKNLCEGKACEATVSFEQKLDNILRRMVLHSAPWCNVVKIRAPVNRCQ